MRPESFIKSCFLPLGALLVAGSTACATAPTRSGPGAEACLHPGTWIDPAAGRTVSYGQVLDRLDGKKVVLLGESHTAMEDHLWQARMLAALQARAGKLVIGFESFPRSAQPVLDRWTAGDLTRAQFLRQVRWDRVWGYDADFYMPLFQFARQNRLRMVALNVNRRLIGKVGQDGWSATPVEDREGVGDPTPASGSYRLALAKVYRTKLRHPRGGIRNPGQGDQAARQTPPPPDLDQIMEMDRFDRFVEAQLTWDRAMAEALDRAASANPEATVVGIIGRGHLEFGHGVPRQLAALGRDDVAVLLTAQAGAACEAAVAEVADALFLVGQEEPRAQRPAKPKLGVIIEADDAGVKILQIVVDSIAEAAKLKAGDLVTQAAGITVRGNQDLIAIIQRQAPGTWLPLKIRRGGNEIEAIAKFPPMKAARE